MSSPVFLQLREIACRSCGVNRLADGRRCACGVYENPNIQLIGGQWRDVRYLASGVSPQIVTAARREGVDHSDMLRAFLDLESRTGRVQ